MLKNNKNDFLAGSLLDQVLVHEIFNSLKVGAKGKKFDNRVQLKKLWCNFK